MTGGSANGAASSGGGTGASTVVLYTALFEVANERGELRPEMTAQVFFVAAEAKDALTVPVAALTATDEASGRHSVAMIGEGGAVVTREVRIGVRDRFNAQILQGLAEGERIVVGWRTDDGRPPRIGFRL